VLIAYAPAFSGVLQVIEFLRKGHSHKGFARKAERLEHLCEISEKRVRHAPFASTDG
jgi:hypothetical protein